MAKSKTINNQIRAESTTSNEAEQNAEVSYTISKSAATGSNQAQVIDQNQGDANQVEMTKRAKQHKKWNRRFKVLFCCLGYKKNKVSL